MRTLFPLLLMILSGCPEEATDPVHVAVGSCEDAEASINLGTTDAVYTIELKVLEGLRQPPDPARVARRGTHLAFPCETIEGRQAGEWYVWWIPAAASYTESHGVL